MTRIAEPQNARSRKTRRAVQVAALELLKGAGARAVTMADVADRAGCSRRAVYLHFPSRAALLASLIDLVDETEGLAADRAPLDAARSGRAAVRELGAFLGRYTPKIAPVVLAVFRARHTDEDAAHMWAAAMRLWRTDCRRVIRRLAREGALHTRFDTQRQAIDFAWAMLSIDLFDRLVSDCGWSAEEYGRHLGAVLERALCR